MINVSTLRQVFNEKLEKTGSMDAAFTKAVWVAYQKGVEDAGKEEQSIERNEE